MEVRARDVVSLQLLSSPALDPSHHARPTIGPGHGLPPADHLALSVLLSPVPSAPNLVALGTKESGGGGFEDYGGELEVRSRASDVHSHRGLAEPHSCVCLFQLHNLNLSDRGMKCTVAGSVGTPIPHRQPPTYPHARTHTRHH